jgi:hypothetical protein
MTNHYIKIANKSSENVMKLRNPRIVVTNQNCIYEEINRSNVENACYYAVQNLSCHLLSKNVKIKIYKNINLPAVLYGCETWSLILQEENNLRMLENRVL